MTYSGTSITKTLSAVVITCAVAAFYTAPVAAQTATSLNCGGCVKSKQIKNGGVKNKDLKDNAVNGQKIADGTVANPDIAGDAVTGDKILDGTVTGADVQDSSLTGTDVQNSSLTGADVQNSSLTGGDVASNSLNSSDISNEAGVDFTGTSTDFNLFGSDATYRSVVVSAPSSGYIIATGSGFFDFNAVSGAARCRVTPSTSTGSTYTYANGGSTIHRYEPFSQTRVFSVGPGAVTIRLVCREDSGNVEINNAHLTAIFVPQRY